MGYPAVAGAGPDHGGDAIFLHLHFEWNPLGCVAPSRACQPAEAFIGGLGHRLHSAAIEAEQHPAQGAKADIRFS